MTSENRIVSFRWLIKQTECTLYVRNFQPLPEINEKPRRLSLESRRCLPDLVSTDEPAGMQRYISLIDYIIFFLFSDFAVFRRSEWS